MTDKKLVAVSLDMNQMRHLTHVMFTTIKEIPDLRDLDPEQLILQQAYTLGVYMRAADVSIDSLNWGIRRAIEQGIEDYSEALKDHEDKKDDSHASDG